LNRFAAAKASLQVAMEQKRDADAKSAKDTMDSLILICTEAESLFD